MFQKCRYWWTRGSVARALAVLRSQSRERLRRRVALQLGQRGEHRVAGHHARDEEVEGDGSDGREQVEADLA